MISVRVVLGLVANMHLELEQIDVKTTFLHGDLENKLYMVQPTKFEVREKERIICWLKNSLYGLK